MWTPSSASSPGRAEIVEDATFATAVTCIDGRVHAPLANWVRGRFGVDHVDLVTEPGADLVCAEDPDARIATILERVEVSTRAHASTTLVIAGHAGCAANPVDEAGHRAHIRRAVQRLRARTDGLAVLGAWVDADGTVTGCRADGAGPPSGALVHLLPPRVTA
jgi:hypothetical protein